MITNKLIIDNINGRLHNRGRSLDGRQILRIAWSGDQYEKRIGTFRDYYGEIFLREYKALKEVAKYWYITPPCWLLERLTFLPPGAKIHEEVLSSKDVDLDIHKSTMNGTYECLYAFRDKHGNPLEVNDRVLDKILWLLEHGGPKKSEGDMREEYHAEIDADAAYFEEEIQSDPNSRSSLFAADNAVSLNHRKRNLTYIEKGKPDEIVAPV